ncbi:indolepyruvate ferredoxin oxidoreductase subunit alpha [Desulforamulus hydrothermalis]|uniref:Indolepyruvate oxidoreductase subunit IorA n=1 Tax=Desulforamulus hydrothermalis Lam5 = DSM 18033 TaxID=1121428 RepID=K8E0P0_9FIRM|nr:indolepyruvate ferredoxin oxidoreductase subunit alpha [Desulforamulus hydrothermalis]CCO09075.1 Indolepyruvate oxidoreductase subunit iorA [Desulforamulus hydrothermalis Lam5 = DSM 18033]SHG78446.1 indolepyruvate ferredoxin oxidoreductase alpha subunit [Desulforamulus hydrothermalis Lam5 = DSM 18033]
MRKLLMGNEAIAYGAAEAGVQVVTGYPGTPSSEILTTLAELAKERGFYVEWSVNEKAALEVAAGACYAGARAMVTMKQVGLNVAADPLMTLAYIGVKGGLVLAVADDPGPHSSQNEQDTRKFAQFAKLPVLDPADPQEAKDMAREAFRLSEELGLPVILRPTTRTCHVCQDVEVAGEYITEQADTGFQKDPRWVIFPSLAAQRHIWLNRQQEKARDIFENSPFNTVLPGDGRLGIIAGGVAYHYVKEALAQLKLNLPVLKIGTPYPLPHNLVLKFIQQLDQVLVVEEQEPVLEDQLVGLIYRHGISLTVSGKHNHLVPREGELDTDKIKGILANFLHLELPAPENISLPPLPVRPPVLCAGCPHRASFYIFKQAAAGSKAVFTGDIGCYTLGNMAPLHAVDTCLCMGASITIGSGLQLVVKDSKVVAFLGDSTFFHTGLPGLINAVHNRANLTVVVLDNRTTAMTGHQSHPGLNRNVSGENVQPLDIAKLAAACGVPLIKVADPFAYREALAAAKEALAFNGVSLVVMRRECVAVAKERKAPRKIDPAKCLNCRLCIEELGCPAIAGGEQAPVISAACTGCDLCRQICPSEAITEGSDVE